MANKLIGPARKIISPTTGREINIPQQQASDNVSDAIKSLEIIDPDKLRVLGLRVLVKIADKERISKGGILLDGASIDKDLFASIKGVIVKQGARAFFEEDEKERPRDGDEVHIAKYSGIPLRDKDFNLYRYTNDTDVIAVQGA